MQLPIDDLNEAFQNYQEDQIDQEFIPFIKRINQLGFVVSCQCCTSHMTSPEGNWGYLSLYINPKFIPIFTHEPDWLFKSRSKTWYTDTIQPTLTPNGSLMIVFAWKAEHWPTPAIEITNQLESLKGKYE